ncbi:hypothetical protein ACHAWX_005082 [Stephanocyclus meneghinianus]
MAAKIDDCNNRVLSIQSHVVSGYVGNKAAVFPLQLLGFDVDIINSVHFSNHTGYPRGWEGDVLDGSKLLKLVDGLERNGLLSDDCDVSDPGYIGHILTGYIGSESFLRSVVTVVKKLKALNSKCRYVCDPVLGDGNPGKFYVPIELVAIYREHADVITPNQFETEQLTGISIQTITDAQHACSILHNIGVPLVLITSITFPPDYCRGADDNLKSAPVNSIAMFASKRSCTTGDGYDCTDEQYILYTPLLSGQFTGTGDICAALFLAWTANMQGDSYLGDALEKLAGTMHAIVKRTAEHAKNVSTSSSTAKQVFSREMRLIQSRNDILNPPKLFHSLKLAPLKEIR